MEPKEEIIKRMKQYRVDLDAVLQRIKADSVVGPGGREKALAVTKTQEAIMWLGMACKELNEGESCYQHGYDPDNAKVDPPADGVKL